MISPSRKVIPFPRRNDEDGEPLMTRAELAERWKKHPDTIAKIPKGELARIEFSTRCVRYLLSDVLAYEQKCRVTED